MTKQELEKLDQGLEQEEKSLVDQLNRIANKNPLAKGDFNVRVPNYGDEDDENAQETIDLDKNFALEQELESKLNSIRKTRQKIKEGTYGKCDKCRSDIAPERLKAMPEAVKCITCAVKFTKS
ncbi:MAG: TraR/DksA C4-type zinc finger protein [Patescibacteria group bacterium]